MDTIQVKNAIQEEMAAMDSQVQSLKEELDRLDRQKSTLEDTHQAIQAVEERVIKLKGLSGLAHSAVEWEEVSSAASAQASEEPELQAEESPSGAESLSGRGSIPDQEAEAGARNGNGKGGQLQLEIPNFLRAYL
ncbi:MAG: hypothetical protein ACE5JX_18130 [Acidobacteriota bacterium]